MTPEDADHPTVLHKDADAPATPAKRKHLPVWQETILLLVIALVLATVIKALFVQAFYIPSASKEPGLVKNDRILVQKVSYWFGGSPQRGDVVVFKDPGGWLSPEESAGPTGGVTKLLAKVGLYPSGGHLVKRVIGVAGDTIKCCDDQGRMMVNGTPLNEKAYARLDGAKCYGPMIRGCDWTAGPVPDGSIFVMGDNRSHSADSSVHMCDGAEDCTDSPYIPTDDVVGKVFVLLWPSDHFRWVHRPDTFADVPSS
ncbi:MAG: signal peptidase Serine peptidase family [Nocardioides sp.]|nr:signal peptidase Serine peptidase family [Nocardioides sp.]